MRSPPCDGPSEEAVLLTVRGTGGLVQVRVHGLTPMPRTRRPILVVLAADGDPDAAGAEAFCRRLGAAGRVVVLHRFPADAAPEVQDVVEWLADHAEPLGARRGEVQLGAVGAAAMSARQVTARIDRAGWPTVIRPLLTASATRPKERLIMTLPPVVDHDTWRKDLAELRAREKAATKELDAIAAQRRRLPMVQMPDYTLVGAEGPIRLVEIFDGNSQLIVYNHMWDQDPAAEWQCGGCTSFTSSFTRLDFLDKYDARFVIVTQGPIDAALAYAERVGNTMTWYSTADSPFGADVDASGGFALNVFLRDGDTVYRTWHTSGRGVEQTTFTFALADLLPYGRQEVWQDSPEGWPQSPTYSAWLDSPDVARLYGPKIVEESS